MMGRGPARPAILAGVLTAAAAAGAASGNYLLVRRDRPVQRVHVAEIGPDRLVHRDAGDGWITVPRQQCVALFDPDALIVTRRRGWLQLADGRRFPGQALSGARSADGVLVWIQSSWLGRMEVPLDRIESVTFVGGAAVPEPGAGDVLHLANGDRIEGIITELGDPVVVEVINGEPAGVVQLPLDRVAAVRMVPRPRRPQGRRLWLVDGTVLDVDEVLLGDDGYFRLEGLPFTVDEPSKRIEMTAVAAVRFDAEALVPFAALETAQVEGPPTRYVVPPPRVLDEFAPLGLSDVAFRGPVKVRYLLPAGATTLSGEARLPVLSRPWADCGVVIRADGQEVFSTRLNAEHPVAPIAAALSGSALTIEITEGGAGPIHDQVVMARGLVLVDTPVSSR